MRYEAVTTAAPARKIQSASRLFLAKLRYRRLVTDRQIEYEWVTMARETTRFCSERARLR